MNPSKSFFIGKWIFNYWPERNKSSILTIKEDGTAVTSNGTWYLWEAKSNNRIVIYNEGYVVYDGILSGDIISGQASSEYSGNHWSWDAKKSSEPIIKTINKNDLYVGWWTLRNEIDEVDDNIVEFRDSGKLLSKKYPVGKWILDDKGLTILTAGGFLRYSAKCVDGVICGRCRNQLGNEWAFKLEHTCIPILDTLLPTSITKQPTPPVTPVIPKRKADAKKSDAQQIVNYLQENGIHYFYHFTAKKNLPSIKENNGLYSWKYLVDNDIVIPDPGGDEWSRELDLNEGLEDFVRLSFCIDHPMKYRKRASCPVLLKVDIEVATLFDTLFSDINAASPKHKHGKGLSDLKRVDLNAVKRTYVSKDDPDFHKHQAEIMVKTHVPLKYLLNINEL